MEKVMQLKTIKEYNDYMGVETRHPLVSVIEGSRMSHPVPHARKHVGMYVIFLKELRCTDDLTYGSSLLRFSGEHAGVYRSGGKYSGMKPTGRLLPVPDGVCCSIPTCYAVRRSVGICRIIRFSHTPLNEALHLSKQEQQTIIDCLTKIDEETYNQADRHTNLIIASAIELLLNYCIRFYDRQFTTRKKENKGMLGSFEALLNDYFVSDKPAERGTLTVAYCADQLNLSANYFGDLIKKETGVSAQEYILTKIMDRAKELLTDPAKSVGDVAYALGYQYPQYFSKAFKRVVGCSPNEYRTLS